MEVTFISFLDPRIPTTDTCAWLIFEETGDIKRGTLKSYNYLAVGLHF